MTDDDVLTLRLDGEVSFADFATAIKEFNALLGSLSSELTGSSTTVQWKVVDLSASSAITTIQGTADDPKDVPSIITAYSLVGQALADRTEIPYSESVRQPANSIASLVNGEVTAIHFNTPIAQHTVLEAPEKTESQLALHTFGAIEGRIRTLSDRRTLRFTLYDSLFDAPVICHLSPDIEDRARQLWRKRVIVEGLVRRDEKTGIPTQIRNIREIHEMPPTPRGSYRAARGALRRVAEK